MKLIALITSVIALLFGSGSVSQKNNMESKLYDLPVLYSYCELLGFDRTDMIIKEAIDPSGAIYLVCEGADNNSYLIYNLEEKAVVEYSFSSKSPYYKKTDNLVYGGPGYYLEQKQDTYISVFNSNELYQISDVEKLNVYTASEEVSQMTKALSTSDKRSVTAAAQDKWLTNVANPEFFYDYCAYNCGYTGGGYCGFIGLGMLLGYADKYKNDNVMDNKFYEVPSTKTGLKNYADGIGQYLVDLNPKSSTTSMHIKNTMNIYSQQRNLEISYYSRYTPFYTNSHLYSTIGSNTPIELFGNFNYTNTSGNTVSTGNHAIVAYGATELNLGGGSTFFWRCHLGWDNGYYDVNIASGTIGSIYYFKI